MVFSPSKFYQNSHSSPIQSPPVKRIVVFNGKNSGNNRVYKAKLNKYPATGDYHSFPSKYSKFGSFGALNKKKDYCQPYFDIRDDERSQQLSKGNKNDLRTYFQISKENQTSVLGVIKDENSDIRNENQWNQKKNPVLEKKDNLKLDSFRKGELIPAPLNDISNNIEIAGDISKQQDLNDIFCDELLPESPKSDPTVPHGLNNLGNTCYLNSVVQTLFSLDCFIEELTKAFEALKKYHSSFSAFEDSNDNFGLTITSNFLDLHKEYLIESKSLIDCLTSFKSCIGNQCKLFHSSDQQDAGEFLISFLGTLKLEIQSRINKCCPWMRNPIEKYFECDLTYDYKCSICNKISTKQPPRSEKLNIIYLPVYNSLPDIQSSFSNWFQPETSNLKCEFCEEELLIEKHFDNLPKVLVFQVIRYSNYTSKEDRDIKLSPFLYLPRSRIQTKIFSPLITHSKVMKSPISKDCIPKIVHRIKFSDDQESNESRSLLITEKETQNENDNNQELATNKKEIDLPNDKKDNLNNNVKMETINKNECERYQLISIICHHGSSLQFGHYTSYVYNFVNQKWFSCDDDQINEVTYDEVERNSSKTGYCYLYAHTI